MARRNMRLINTGLICGSVTCQNTSQAEFPSILALSYGSGDRLVSAAAVPIITKGVHCQMSAMAMAQSAHCVDVIHGIGLTPKKLRK